jgi:molecular chaperone GrpE
MIAKKKTGELEELQTKVAELDNQLKRAVADYQNLERRITEGRSELSNWTNAELIKKLLPVLDHLETALNGIGEQEKQTGWARGVELAVKEFNNVLAQEGLDQIETTGQFDPNLHEAVDMRDGENEMILEVAKKGYNLNGKVLRPAQVVVGRSQNKEEN